MNPYLRMALALALGLLIGLSLGLVIGAIPWRWLQLTTVLVLLGGALVWNVRELRWLRRTRQEMLADHARIMAMIERNR